MKTWLRTTGACVTTIIVVACFAEPKLLLTGEWGGRAIHLNAREPEVQLRFPCMHAALSELSLDSAGHFEGTARITWRSFGSDPTAALLVAGDVNGVEMSLSVTYTSRNHTDPEPDRYSLRLGAPPDFSGIGCLA